MSLHDERPGPPKQTRQVFAVSSRGGQTMRVNKTFQDSQPVKERARVQEAAARTAAMQALARRI